MLKLLKIAYSLHGCWVMGNVVKLLVTSILTILIFSITSCAKPALAPLPPVEEPPAAPSGVSAQADSYSQVIIRWVDNSANEQGFRIYRNGLLVASVGPNVIEFQDKGLQYSTAYTYEVATYNDVGERRCAIPVEVKTLNPPIMVTLDKIGVVFAHDPWPFQGPGDIYVYLAISDSKAEPQVIRIPPSGTLELNNNESKEIREQVFSSDCVGDELKVVAVAFEADNPVIAQLAQLLTGALLSYVGGGTGEAVSLLTTLLKSQPSEDEEAYQELAESPVDDFVGAIERIWTAREKWGVGSYEDVRSGDLRLWFTISMPIETTSPQPLSPTEPPIPPATPAEPIPPVPPATPAPPAPSLPPVIIVTSPNGGEIWFIGTTQIITWMSNISSDTDIEIWISRDAGSTWTTIITSTPNDGIESWTVTNPATTEAMIRVVGPGIVDTSDSYFTVAPPPPPAPPQG